MGSGCGEQGEDRPWLVGAFETPPPPPRAAEWLGEVTEERPAPGPPRHGASSCASGCTGSALELHVTTPVLVTWPSEWTLRAPWGRPGGADPQSPAAPGRVPVPAPSCYRGSWSDALRIKDTRAPHLTPSPARPWLHGDTLPITATF